MGKGKFQSTKIFDNYSVAIRQWRAQHSHCQLLHGYALKFKVWFESNTPEDENMGLDDMNWIVDYGGFKDAPVVPLRISKLAFGLSVPIPTLPAS